jgi:hypothetical protein
MRSQFRKEFSPSLAKLVTADMQGMAHIFYSPPGIYFLYSYSGIYLVIEGWKNLNLKDDRVEKLLESPFVDRLRLFRNATFHYQKEPISWKHLQFFGTEEEETEVRLNELYREFEPFFADCAGGRTERGNCQDSKPRPQNKRCCRRLRLPASRRYEESIAVLARSTYEPGLPQCMRQLSI